MLATLAKRNTGSGSLSERFIVDLALRNISPACFFLGRPADKISLKGRTRRIRRCWSLVAPNLANRRKGKRLDHLGG
jgi:hypothetical protein